MPANMLLLGAAYQRGALPVSREALEQAIRLNGAAVEKNLAAFGWGRAVVAAPDSVAIEPPPGEPDSDAPLAERRAAELVAYQSAAYARRYRELVERVRVAETGRVPGHGELAAAVARNLFKLMAYKDEYEVARLHLDTFEQAKLQREFGEEAKVWFNLHPPLLRALGHEAQAQARRAGSCRRCALLRGGAPPARHAARPVRLRQGAARRAGADRRVRAARGRAARAS